MSTVIVVTPLIIANWPVIVGAVTAAVGSLGFAVASDSAVAARRSTSAVTRAEIEIEDSEILDQSGACGEELVVERNGVRGIFSRDARGALRVCMEGTGVSKSELKRIGEELIGSVTQQYVYHRVVSELKERRMTIVDEEVDADRAVRIRVRNSNG